MATVLVRTLSNLAKNAKNIALPSSTALRQYHKLTQTPWKCIQTGRSLCVAETRYPLHQQDANSYISSLKAQVPSNSCEPEVKTYNVVISTRKPFPRRSNIKVKRLVTHKFFSSSKVFEKSGKRFLSCYRSYIDSVRKFHTNTLRATTIRFGNFNQKGPRFRRQLEVNSQPRAIRPSYRAKRFGTRELLIKKNILPRRKNTFKKFKFKPIPKKQRENVKFRVEEEQRKLDEVALQKELNILQTNRRIIRQQIMTKNTLKDYPDSKYGPNITYKIIKALSAPMPSKKREITLKRTLKKKFKKLKKYKPKKKPKVEPDEKDQPEVVSFRHMSAVKFEKKKEELADKTKKKEGSADKTKKKQESADKTKAVKKQKS